MPRTAGRALARRLYLAPAPAHHRPRPARSRQGRAELASLAAGRRTQSPPWPVPAAPSPTTPTRRDGRAGRRDDPRGESRRRGPPAIPWSEGRPFPASRGRRVGWLLPGGRERCCRASSSVEGGRRDPRAVSAIRPLVAGSLPRAPTTSGARCAAGRLRHGAVRNLAARQRAADLAARLASNHAPDSHGARQPRRVPHRAPDRSDETSACARGIAVGRHHLLQPCVVRVEGHQLRAVP